MANSPGSGSASMSPVTVSPSDAFQADAFQADAFQMVAAPAGAVATASASTGHERGRAEPARLSGETRSSPGSGSARS